VKSLPQPDEMIGVENREVFEDLLKSISRKRDLILYYSFKISYKESTFQGITTMK
jgi:hypothetical protein